MLAYKEKFIKDLTKQDTKVAISGFIVDKNDNNIIVDDSTGSIPVIIETNLSLNNFVRVFGSLIYSNEPQLQAHLIQDLNDVNKKLYQKVKLLLNQK